MEDSDLAGLTVAQAPKIVKANKGHPIKGKKFLEARFAEVWQKYQSMPQSYVPNQDEYSVLDYYRERFADDTQYEEVSRRFWKHHGGAADGTTRSPLPSSSSSQRQTQNTNDSCVQLSDPFDGSSIDRIQRALQPAARVSFTMGANVFFMFLNDWDLPCFMKTQFDDEAQADIGPVITLSGSALCAQATTCSEYIGYTWPLYGAQVLEVFQLALLDSCHRAYGKVGSIQFWVALRNGRCKIRFSDGGDNQTLSQIWEQSVWMGAALRISSNQRVQHSGFDLQLDPNRPIVEVNFWTHDLPEEEESCWVPLFANPTIAHGFPVRKRDNEEQGIEIPLEMMAALGGARLITNYEEGLVLKGFSTMFVPVKRYQDSVQWHFIYDEQGNRLSYHALKGLSTKRAMLDDVPHDFLRGARAFLGWWKAAETHLGTQEAAYGSIDWSAAKEPGRPIKFSGGEIGLERVVTAKLSFIMGAKDGPFHYSRPRPFQQLINGVRDTPVTLYDLQDRRAWLVPALDVMLHIVLTRHYLCPYQVRGKVVELATAAPHRGFLAEYAILRNSKLGVYESDGSCDKDYSFKDAIIDLWSQMEFLKEKQDHMEGASGPTLHGTTRSKLHGWEFMSLVHEKNYRKKEAPIEKSSGGWVDLIGDIDSLVLMGTGFRDVIRPVSDINRLCRKWRSLPQGMDYLAASVPIMEILYAEAGSRTSRKHLSTNHLQWHRGLTLFEDCTDPNSDLCKCDRTQQIYQDSFFRTLGQVRPPGKLENMGCVIFGQAHHSLKPTKTVRSKQNSVFNLPNVALQRLEHSTQTPPPDEPLILSSSNEGQIPALAMNRNPRITLPKSPGSPPPTRDNFPCFADGTAKWKREMPEPSKPPKMHKPEKDRDTNGGDNTSCRAHISHNGGDISEGCRSYSAIDRTQDFRQRETYSESGDDYGPSIK